jgi:membrane-associated phospholipid phosphatase
MPRYRVGLILIPLAAVAAAFVTLAFVVRATPDLAFDLHITRAVQAFDGPAIALLMRLVSWPGYSPQVVIVAGLIVLALYGARLQREAGMALVAAVVALAVPALIKALIRRPRPLPGTVHVYTELVDYSFPSGHVMFYVVFGGFVGFLALRLLQPSAMRSLLLAGIGSLIALVGLSRVYLGVHWASDVLGSYLLGGLIVAGLAEIYLRKSTRRVPATAVNARKQP